jgi:hypothetical protein
MNDFFDPPEMKNGVNIYTTDENPLCYYYFMKFCNCLENFYHFFDYSLEHLQQLYYDINEIVIKQHIY